MPTVGFLSLRERKRFVDGLAVATIAAMFVSAAVPWFLHATEIDLQAVAWAAFFFAYGYVTIAVIVDRIGNRKLVAVALFASPPAAIVMGAVLWHFAGGIDEPGLLTALAIPVIASAILPNRWAPYVVAAFAAVVVMVTALIESPAFGWYLTQIGLPIQSLFTIIPVVTSAVRLTELPPAALFTSLQAFTVAMFIVAGLCRSIVRFAFRESEREVHAASDVEGTFAGSALRASPTPLVVVAADTAQIVDGSATFFQRVLSRRDQVAGKELFDVVRFEDRDAVHALLEHGGRIELISCRVGEEERLLDVRAQRFRLNDADYCTVTMHEWEGVGYLAAAEDARDRPLLIAGSDGRLRYSNRAAALAIGDVYVGRDIASLVENANRGSVTINSREYEAAISELRSPVSADLLELITLTPREQA